MALTEVSVGQPASCERAVEVPSPRRMPMTPPRELRVTASMRNWVRMSEPCAPRAMRMPISRVRSVTLTSMIFMMPMPPTTSDTLAIAPKSSRMILEVAVAISAISCWLRTMKSLSRSAPSRCRCRSSAVMACTTAAERSSFAH